MSPFVRYAAREYYLLRALWRGQITSAEWSTTKRLLLAEYRVASRA